MARNRNLSRNIIDEQFYESFSFPIKNQYKFDLFDDIETIPYIVKEGDRLDTLAAIYLNDDTAAYMIADVNNLLSYEIFAGQKLNIPVNKKTYLDKIPPAKR